MNPLLALMMQYNQSQSGPQPFNDTMGQSENARAHQQMLNQRGATVYRNVGPSDLSQFPDSNAYKPDDLMMYRMMQGGSERI